MKILIIGLNGFIGRNSMSVLSKDYDVVGAENSDKQNNNYINLLDKNSIGLVLSKTKPDVIVNCSGIVENSEKAKQNPIFIKNLLEEIVKSKLELTRLITLGSAAEYGEINADRAKIDENTPLNAKSEYGLSKIEELEIITHFRERNNLPIVTTRIFNPIGIGMNNRLLIPQILNQIKNYKKGKTDSIEITRLDSKRDYVDVKDVALAIKAIISGHPKSFIYNVGSGVSTTNSELLKIIIRNSHISKMPKIVETSPMKESRIADKADISLMKKEFGWTPKTDIDETVKEIIDGGQ